MLSRRSRYTLIATLVCVLVSTPGVVFGQEVGGIYRLFGLSSNSPALLVLRILQIIWIIGAIIAVSFLGYALYALRVAGDDLLKHANAKTVAKYSGIGLVLCLLLAGVITFVLSRMEAHTSVPIVTEQGVSEQTSFATLNPARLGAFSRIVSHYPQRDDRNIPRNARLIITFSQAIDEKSLADEQGRLRENAIAIAKLGTKDLVRARVLLDSEKKTATIIPDQLLGEDGSAIEYSAGISSKILLPDGNSIFGSTGNYIWKFEVSGSSDNTPPRVESVVPTVGSQVVFRNALIQITFSEAIDASLLKSGVLEVMDVSNKKPIEGTFVMGNSYKTVTFIPREFCGKNACNQPVSCLPQGSNVNVRIKAASLSRGVGADSNKAVTPYDGVVDLAGNSLDGGSGKNSNGKSQGDPDDSYVWSFKVGDSMNQVTPRIAEVKPARDAQSVDGNTPISLAFSQLMDLTSLHESSVMFDHSVNYWLTTKSDYSAGKTTVQIQHDPLKASSIYTPEVRSEVRDIYQNCFSPCNGPIH